MITPSTILTVTVTVILAIAGLIWFVIRLAMKPTEVVIDNNTTAMQRMFATLERHEVELGSQRERIAKVEVKTEDL